MGEVPGLLLSCSSWELQTAACRVPGAAVIAVDGSPLPLPPLHFPHQPQVCSCRGQLPRVPVLAKDGSGYPLPASGLGRKQEHLLEGLKSPQHGLSMSGAADTTPAASETSPAPLFLNSYIGLWWNYIINCMEQRHHVSVCVGTAPE